jgi:hypothetical protein
MGIERHFLEILVLSSIVHIFIAITLLMGEDNPKSENLVNGDKWVIDYKNLGGIASYNSDDGGSIQIQKRSNNKPLISINAMRSQPIIRKLEVQGYEIDDDDIIAIAKWKKISIVYIIDGKKVTDKGVIAIASSPELTKITICGTSITDVGIGAFSGNKTLTYLNIESYAKDNKTINMALKEMPLLEKLFVGCNGLKSINLSKLPKLQSLENIPSTVTTIELNDLASVDELDFSGTQLDKLTLSALPKLAKLNVQRTKLSRESIKSIKDDYPNINIKR